MNRWGKWKIRLLFSSLFLSFSSLLFCFRKKTAKCSFRIKLWIIVVRFLRFCCCMKLRFETSDPSSSKCDIIFHSILWMNQFTCILIDLIIVRVTIFFIIFSIILTEINAFSNTISEWQCCSNMDTSIWHITNTTIITGYSTILWSRRLINSEDSNENERSNETEDFVKERKNWSNMTMFGYLMKNISDLLSKKIGNGCCFDIHQISIRF